MSAYLCSNETLSIVTDVVTENFNSNSKETFHELLEYNLENLDKYYGDREVWECPREYIPDIDCSEAQKVESIRNYLYQSADYVDNFLIHWLDKYSDKYYYLVEANRDDVVWDAEELFEETPEPEIIGLEGKGLTVKECAKLIRKDLRACFGKAIKFSVTSNNIYGTIRVSIKKISKELTYDRNELINQEYKHHGKEKVDSYYENGERIIRDDIIKNIEEIYQRYNYENRNYDGIYTIPLLINEKDTF